MWPAVSPVIEVHLGEEGAVELCKGLVARAREELGVALELVSRPDVCWPEVTRHAAVLRDRATGLVSVATSQWCDGGQAQAGQGREA